MDGFWVGTRRRPQVEVCYSDSYLASSDRDGGAGGAGGGDGQTGRGQSVHRRCMIVQQALHGCMVVFSALCGAAPGQGAGGRRGKPSRYRSPLFVVGG